MIVLIIHHHPLADKENRKIPLADSPTNPRDKGRRPPRQTPVAPPGQVSSIFLPSALRLVPFMDCIVSQLIPQRFDLQHPSPASSHFVGAHHPLGLCAPGRWISPSRPVQRFATFHATSPSLHPAGERQI
jgi:hypothetical protein